MATVALTKDNFEQVVTGNDMVLVDFWAPWCGPCRAMAPHFAQAAAMLEPEVRLVKLDTDQARRTAMRLDIGSIPTLALFRSGQEVARTQGAMPAAALTAWVRRQLGGEAPHAARAAV